MTGLLVSVRNGSEAKSALLGGADIVDVKEPLLGSLGAAEADVWQEVAGVVDQEALLSVALGELVDFDPVKAVALPKNTHYAKIGLAGCVDVLDWPRRWRIAWDCLPAHVQRVAVCYVDQNRARAPSWDQILKHARYAGCKCLLLDTFDKRAGNLFAHWDKSYLARVVAQASDHELFVVAGGSLRGEHLGLLSGTGVRFVAVRGAVCRTSRTGPLDEDLVKQLRVACDASKASIVAG